MRAFVNKLKPASGFAHFVHIGFNLLLPAILFVLVRIFPIWVALGLLLLSKWRMIAVRPRHWPVHFRINAVDLMVGISVIIFMAHSSSESLQLVWAVALAIWLVWLKPMTSILGIALQALVGETVALMALFATRNAPPIIVLIVLSWLICYLAARHFFLSFEDKYGSLYAHIWGYFAAALAWVLSHWLLFYGSVAQPTLILTILAFGLGSLYYLDQTDRLSNLLRRQFVFTMVAVIFALLVLSDWSSKIF